MGWTIIEGCTVALGLVVLFLAGRFLHGVKG